MLAVFVRLHRHITIEYLLLSPIRVFFITNLVVAPLLTFIMIIGIIVLFLASFGITTVLTKPLEWGIYGLNSTIHYVASFEQFSQRSV
jgi:competence protein ComEC